MFLKSILWLTCALYLIGTHEAKAGLLSFQDIVAAVGEQGAGTDARTVGTVGNIGIFAQDRRFYLAGPDLALVITANLRDAGNNFVRRIDPYLDDLSGGKPAGLGACQTITAGLQCNPSNDDNVTFREQLVLSFYDGITVNGLQNDGSFNGIGLGNRVNVDLSDLTYRDGDHNPLPVAGTSIDLVALRFDGLTLSTISPPSGSAVELPTAIEQVSLLSYNNRNQDGLKFYLDSHTNPGTTTTQVPEPAPLLAIAVSLLVMGGLLRRRETLPA